MGEAREAQSDGQQSLLVGQPFGGSTGKNKSDE